MAEDDLAEKEMDLEAVQVSIDIFGSEDDLMDASLDLAEFKFHNRCKFCERKFDSSGKMGRHIGCKHTRDGEAFLNLTEKEVELSMDAFCDK